MPLPASAEAPNPLCCRFCFVSPNVALLTFSLAAVRACGKFITMSWIIGVPLSSSANATETLVISSTTLASRSATLNLTRGTSSG